MPTKCGLHDSKGYFCRWGGHGKKYYYTKGDKDSMERARKKADAQGQAAHASGYQGAKLDTINNSIDNMLKQIDNLRKNL